MSKAMLERMSPIVSERVRQGGFAWIPIVAAVAGSLAGKLLGGNQAAGLSRAERRLLDTQREIQTDQWEEYKKTFRPVEREVAAQALQGLPEERFVSQASTDVGQAFDKAGAIAKRNLRRYGVNPSSGRFAGVERETGIARAATEAGARTGVRRYVADENFNRLLVAAQLGRGLPSTAVNAGATAAGGYANLANQAAAGAGQVAELISNLPYEKLFQPRQSASAPTLSSPSTSTDIREYPSFAEGGLVGPEGGVVEPHEFVVPREVVLRKGTEFFEKLIEQTRGKGLPRNVIEGRATRVS